MPKNRLSADEILKSEHFCEDGKMMAVKQDYRCDYYIQAITIKETLEVITNKEYTIEKDGVQGWKVVVQKRNQL